MILPQHPQRREEYRPAGGLVFPVIGGARRNGSCVRILRQHLQNEARRLGNAGICHGGVDVDAAVFQLLGTDSNGDYLLFVDHDFVRVSQSDMQGVLASMEACNLLGLHLPPFPPNTGMPSPTDSDIMCAECRNPAFQGSRTQEKRLCEPGAQR